MKIFFKKIYRPLQKFWRLISGDILATLEELRAIVRNRKYMTRYPKLFAIFAIIEHEQSSQVFELNHADFEMIKNEILHDQKINNHHILECLRGLFHGGTLAEAHRKERDKILCYIYDELNQLIKSGDRYYDPLVKAILRGFPLILSYDDYGVLRKLLHYKSRSSLRLIKYILDKENFDNFFTQDSDLADVILAAHQIDNKPAFMMLIRYLRQNNLWKIVFENNHHDIKNKIFSVHAIDKKGFDCGLVMLSYYDDKWFVNEKKIEKMQHFLREVFLHHDRVDQKHKIIDHDLLSLSISMSRALGYENFIIEKMLADISDRFLDKKNHPKKLRIKFTIKPHKAIKNKPSTKIKPQDFLAIAKLAPEENWLLNNAAYLL